MAEGYEPSGLTPEEFAALPPYDEIAGKKFSEVAAIYGEEIAINVIIATDPDCWVPTEEEFARARPAIKVDPDLVNAYLAAKANRPNRVNVELSLDQEVVTYFHSKGGDWKALINDVLRRAVIEVDIETDSVAPAPTHEQAE